MVSKSLSVPCFMVMVVFLDDEIPEIPLKILVLSETFSYWSHGPVEIVDLPSYKIIKYWIFSYKSPFSHGKTHGFPMVFWDWVDHVDGIFEDSMGFLTVSRSPPRIERTRRMSLGRKIVVPGFSDVLRDHWGQGLEHIFVGVLLI